MLDRVYSILSTSSFRSVQAIYGTMQSTYGTVGTYDARCYTVMYHLMYLSSSKLSEC